MIAERDYIWGSFVWNLFDFSSSSRREGDTNNLNGKLIGTQKTDDYKTVEWKNVQLQPGVYTVEIRTAHGNDGAE